MNDTNLQKSILYLFIYLWVIKDTFIFADNEKLQNGIGIVLLLYFALQVFKTIPFHMIAI